MRLLRPVLPLLALFLIGLAPSCKKSAEGEASDAVSSDSTEKAEKNSEGKKSKKSKAKAKQKKADPSDEGAEGSGEGKEEGATKSRSKKSKASDKAEEAGGDGALIPAEERAAKPLAGKPAKEKDALDTTGETLASAKSAGASGDKAAEPVHSLPPNAGTPPEEVASAPAASQLGIGRLLTNTDLNSQLPMKGWAGHGPVPGIAPSEFYNSILYKIPNTSAFVAIQVWDYDTPSMSLEKWNEIQQTYPNAEVYAEGFVKDALYSYRNQVKTFSFYEPKLSMVVALSCYVQACEDSALYQLSELVYARLQTK